MLIRPSHLFSAHRAGRCHMGSLKPCARSKTLDKISMAEFADLSFQFLWHPNPVSHPDAAGKPHIPVAAFRVCFESFAGQFKKQYYALVCQVLYPFFLFFAHGGLFGAGLQIIYGTIGTTSCRDNLF